MRLKIGAIKRYKTQFSVIRFLTFSPLEKLTLKIPTTPAVNPTAPIPNNTAIANTFSAGIEGAGGSGKYTICGGP